LINTSNRKGRVAQIATGKGKSITIALLASALGLMGGYVDVMTSSHDLAGRDEKEFRPVSDVLGLVSSSIAFDDPPQSAFNGRILYGTNTDFEFGYLLDQLKGGQDQLRQHPYVAGGLHVVVALFPINFRGECQAYGRTGRQGRKGTCQIICSIDESFISDALKISNVNTAVEQFYSQRSQWIALESMKRLISVKRDDLFFKVLQCYFSYIRELSDQSKGGQGTKA
jgi:preprotein translocase subunit SecA